MKKKEENLPLTGKIKIESKNLFDSETLPMSFHVLQIWAQNLKIQNVDQEFQKLINVVYLYKVRYYGILWGYTRKKGTRIIQESTLHFSGMTFKILLKYCVPESVHQNFFFLNCE